jgi:hypothetical protein
MWHVCETGQAHAGFWWGNLREREQLEDPTVGGRMILKCSFKKWVGAWTGLILLRIGTGCGHL